jgi:drug/metabolite transporter (DMT)-like permease
MRPAVHLVLAAVQLMFASLAIAGRFVLPRFPAGTLVSFRVLGATVVLFIVNAVSRGTWVWGTRDLCRLAVLGLLGIAANQTLFIYGLQHTTAINASILVTTVPVFTVVGSVLTGRESATPLMLAGVALAGLGTVYLIGPDGVQCGLLHLLEVGGGPVRFHHRQFLCHALCIGWRVAVWFDGQS